MPETKDLLLRKGVLDDWKDMFRNVWRHPESAKHMAWSVTETEADAIARMERTIAFQAAHEYHWTVVEKASGQAIGWAGMQLVSEGVWSETGIALGPAFIGKGYGTQLLNFLTNYARDELGAKTFLACCNSENIVSKKLQLRCGFTYSHSEKAIHHRDRIPYTLDHYKKELSMSENITLRPFLPEDREQILDILTNKTVAKTYMLPDFAERADALPLFERLSSLSCDESRFVRCIAADGKAVGFLNDVEVKDGQIELGYAIHPDCHGKGYMTAALKLAICQLLNTYNTVICGAFEGNSASMRVMEKSGMKKIDYTDTVEYRGKTHRCIYYAASKEK